jgi:hypothetical protein
VDRVPTVTKSTPNVDRVFAELHLLAGANGRYDIKKLNGVFDDIDWILRDMSRRLDAIEKSSNPLAHRPHRSELSSWSPAGLAAVLAHISPEELAKLQQ